MAIIENVSLNVHLRVVLLIQSRGRVPKSVIIPQDILDTQRRKDACSNARQAMAIQSPKCALQPAHNLRFKPSVII